MLIFIGIAVVVGGVIIYGLYKLAKAFSYWGEDGGA